MEAPFGQVLCLHLVLFSFLQTKAVSKLLYRNSFLHWVAWNIDGACMKAFVDACSLTSQPFCHLLFAFTVIHLVLGVKLGCKAVEAPHLLFFILLCPLRFLEFEVFPKLPCCE